MAMYNFTVRAKDETGAFSDRDFAIQIRNNIIDRILVIDGTHAYASHNGVDFTIRANKGGQMACCLLDKWVVFTDPSTYRLSADTISWIDENKLEYIDDEDVVRSFSVETRQQDHHFIEHNGVLYCIGTSSVSDTKPALFKTTDLITWEMVKPENFNAAENTFLGLGQSISFASFSTTPMYFSNIIIDGDSLLWFDALNRRYTRYNTVTNVTDTIVPVNRNLIPNYNAANQVFLNKLNGIYLIYYPQRIFFSSDMVNLNTSPIPNDTNRNGVVSLTKRAFYHNGVMYFSNGNRLVSGNTPTTLSATTLLLRDVGVFKGNAIRITNSGVFEVMYDHRQEINASNGYRVVSSLPTSIFSFAILP